MKGGTGLEPAAALAGVGAVGLSGFIKYKKFKKNEDYILKYFFNYEKEDKDNIFKKMDENMKRIKAEEGNDYEDIKKYLEELYGVYENPRDYFTSKIDAKAIQYLSDKNAFTVYRLKKRFDKIIKAYEETFPNVDDIKLSAMQYSLWRELIDSIILTKKVNIGSDYVSCNRTKEKTPNPKGCTYKLPSYNKFIYGLKTKLYTFWKDVLLKSNKSSNYSEHEIIHNNVFKITLLEEITKHGLVFTIKASLKELGKYEIYYINNLQNIKIKIDDKDYTIYDGNNNQDIYNIIIQDDEDKKKFINKVKKELEKNKLTLYETKITLNKIYFSAPEDYKLEENEKKVKSTFTRTKKNKTGDINAVKNTKKKSFSLRQSGKKKKTWCHYHSQ